MSAASGSTRRIAKGAGWMYSYRWIDRLLGFASLTVLARLLEKDDFGLVAVAASFVFIIEGLSEFDVKSALIQSRDDDRDLFDSAWTLSFLRGVLAAGVMVSVAPFVGDPRVQEILYVLALCPLLDGLANPSFVLFERELDYSKLARVTLMAAPAAFLVTVGTALATGSYWALVFGMITTSLVTLVATYALRPYRPRPTFARFREIVSFSGWMTVATVVSTLSMRTDRLVVGWLLGFADAGAYFMTQRIGVLPTAELVSPLQRILFPSFSEMTGDPERLRRAVRQSVGVLASLSLPAAFGFALVANDFVPLALGERWTQVASLLVVLVPFLGLRATLSCARPCVMALGETHLMARVSTVYGMIHFPAFLLGTALFGLEGAIWSIVAAGGFYIWLNAWLLKQTVGLSPWSLLRELARPATAVAVMCGAVFALDWALPLDLFAVEGSWTALGLKVAVGGLAFLGVQLSLWRLAGRPDGIERRVLQLIAGARAPRA